MSTILVLEDDMELNQTITYALTKEGYHVYSAYTCKEAEQCSCTVRKQATENKR